MGGQRQRGDSKGAVGRAAIAGRRSDMILATRYGFHGKKGLAGAVTGSESDPERDPRVRFIGFPTTRCDERSTCAASRSIWTPTKRNSTRLWTELGQRICCLVTEPYLGGGGSYHPQNEYLQLLERFCREHDIVFILDEVQANFGRTGSMYAFTHYGVEPDIVVLGKGLGNGVPVECRGRPCRSVRQACTTAKAPTPGAPTRLACAAVLATLDEFESTDVLGHARQLAGVLEAGPGAADRVGRRDAVRGEGVVWGIECGAVAGHSADDGGQCLRRGLLLRRSIGPAAIHLLGPLAGKVLRVSPPLVMPLDEANEYLEPCTTSLPTVQRRLAAATATMTHEDLMRLAIEKALARGSPPGQTPFGCAIAHWRDRVLGNRSQSRAGRRCDITAQRRDRRPARSVCRHRAAAVERRDRGHDVRALPDVHGGAALGTAWIQVYYGASIADATAAGFNELNIPAADMVSAGGQQRQAVGRSAGRRVPRTVSPLASGQGRRAY